MTSRFKFTFAFDKVPAQPLLDELESDMEAMVREAAEQYGIDRVFGFALEEDTED
jgi:8-oxo-dGTP pyrophosphatase MutT (NUDIX family)